MRTRTSIVVVGAVLSTGLIAADMPPSQATDTGPTHYVALSDGIELALNVTVPEGCDAANPCPAVFEMSGYESGSADGKTPAGTLNDQFEDVTGQDPGLPLQGGTRASHGGFHDDEYAVVLASVRGTGCSGGEFDLFSWRSALDGREIIDGWIAQQPWSNGDIAIWGHSYSGITGTMVAATQPEHLRVVSVSGLIGDVYRDIVYPGGITNYGFPLLWTGAVRPAYDVGGGVGGGLYPAPQQDCLENQATKSRTVFDEPLIQGLDDQDSEWYRSRSLVTWTDKIEVPVHVTAAYQDEQTGPRGPTNVFDHLPDTISRRLQLTNGDHGTQTDSQMVKDRLAWIDYWMLGRNLPHPREAAAFEFAAPQTCDKTRSDGRTNRGKGKGKPAPDEPGDCDNVYGDLRDHFGPRDVPTTTVRVRLGHRGADRIENGEVVERQAVGELTSDAFPLTETRFTDLYLSADGTATFDREAVVAGDVSWLHGSRRQAYSYQAGVNNGGEVTAADGPDQATFAVTFDEPTVIAGPITATLNITATAPDTELFVQLVDLAPTGEQLFLQRGMLKASHRAMDEGLSDRTADGRIYRPWRPHVNPTLITPGETIEYLIDVFPVGHVFLPGHQLVVKVHAPPIDDNDYNYVPKTVPGQNTLSTSPEAPSRLMLPIVPLDEVQHLDLDVAPCQYSAMRCVTAGA